MGTEFRRNEPDFFFPIALITVGVTWLLLENGTIAIENVYRLLPLWPVLLIAGGVALLLRRIWWPLSGLVWALLAAAVLWALVYSPALLPSVTVGELNHETLSEPLGEAKSAAVQLDLSINHSEIHARENGSELIYADLFVYGDAILDSSGTAVKNVYLHQGPFSTNTWWNFGWLMTNSQPWDIQLTTEIPLQLEVDAGTGSTDIDLTGMSLESLDIHAGTGSIDLVLPEGQETFPFQFDGGTGSMNIIAPKNTAFELEVDGGTGSFNLDLPDDAGVQVEVTDGGLGSLNLPDDFKKVSGDSDDDEGIYQTGNFDDAAKPIKIRLSIGTGSVSID